MKQQMTVRLTNSRDDQKWFLMSEKGEDAEQIAPKISNVRRKLLMEIKNKKRKLWTKKDESGSV